MEAWEAGAWLLAGEGSRALVLRDGEGRALRLLKVPPVPAALSPLEEELWGHLPGFTDGCAAERAWLFASRVLVPLLGERNAAAGVLVHPPAAFLRQLEHRLGAGRAGLRLEGAAVLLPDAAALPPLLGMPAVVASPTFAVELKPKCGFLPSAATVAQHCVKRLVSRFALHQRIKHAQGRVTQACAPALHSACC